MLLKITEVSLSIQAYVVTYGLTTYTKLVKGGVRVTKKLQSRIMSVTRY